MLSTDCSKFILVLFFFRGMHLPLRNEEFGLFAVYDGMLHNAKNPET